MNAWLPFAHAWLLDLAVLTTVLLAAALLLGTVLRDAKSRVLLAWCTWLGIAAAALVTLLPGWPRYEFRALSQSMSREQPIAVITAIEPDVPVAVDWDAPVDSSTVQPIDTPKPPSPIAPWRDLSILAWLAAALASLAWIALGAWQARRLLRRSQPAPQWIAMELSQICQSAVGNALRGVPFLHRRTMPELRTSAQLASAVALRARKPAILLPHASADLAHAPAIRAALAHEWAHILHGDLWLLALERLLLPLLALHPLFWWLRRSTRLDQELLADAAAAGDKPVEYAEALVAWAKTSSPPPASLAALAFWDRPTNLTRRVHMILHQPRTATTWFGRLLSIAALASLLALVAGLSLITQQPLAADDEPARPAAAPLTDERPPALPETLAAAAPVQHLEAIQLACTVIEVDDAQNGLAVLSKGTQGNLPDFRRPITLTHALIDDWQKVAGDLKNVPGFKVLSRPQVRTLNNRPAMVQLSPEVPALNLPVLKLELVPELLAFVGDKRQVLLTVTFERTTLELQTVPDGGKVPVQVAGRLQSKVAVPLGKTLLVMNPFSRSPATERALLLAIEPKIVQLNENVAENAVASDPSAARASELSKRTEELRQQLTRQIEPNDLESRREAAAVRHSLLRLQREIAALLDQTAAKAEAAADPFGAPANAGGDPFGTAKAQTKPGKAAKRVETRHPPQFVPVDGDPEKALTQVQLRMKELKIDGVTIGVDSKSGSLMVSGSEQQVGEVRKLLFELERTAKATTEQQLQQKLLELDLREAEINLQSAETEHERMAEIRKKNSGVISESELRQSRLKVELAQLQVERMKVRIDAARTANPPATPAGPRR